MHCPDFIVLYVCDVAVSTEFYRNLLGRQEDELFADFAMFRLDTGIKLALWAKQEVEPRADVTGGGAELCFAATDATEVQAMYEDWTKRGLVMAQKPVNTHFGYTFVALDPDQHRLRVYSPKADRCS